MQLYTDGPIHNKLAICLIGDTALLMVNLNILSPQKGYSGKAQGGKESCASSHIKVPTIQLSN